MGISIAQGNTPKIVSCRNYALPSVAATSYVTFLVTFPNGETMPDKNYTVTASVAEFSGDYAPGSAHFYVSDVLVMSPNSFYITVYNTWNTALSPFLQFVAVQNTGAQPNLAATVVGDTSWKFMKDTGSGLQNSWGEYDATGTWSRPAYRKMSNGMVECRGLLLNNGSGGVFFTLPSGYRPGASGGSLIFCLMGGANTAQRVDVNPNGAMSLSGTTLSSGQYMSLSGISFYADQ